MTNSEWKIITVSNFDLESYRQQTVAEHITSENYGEIMLKALQSTVKEGDPTWFKMVPQSKRLWLGMEEFVDTTCESCGADLFGKECCLNSNIG